jgi:Arc/MetJ-type ribon-helix-helix transcriptional regulator
MAKDTVRYPDSVVEEIERVVEEHGLESKSEFHRFAAEFVLSLIDEGYETESFQFDELADELELDPAAPPRALSDGAVPFMDAFVTVRKHGLRGEYEAAETYIDDHFDGMDQASLLLEEVLDRYREAAGPEE